MKKKVKIGHRLDNNEDVNLDIDEMTHLLATASSGYGKSTALRLILERTNGLMPEVVIDREGEFGTIREEIDCVLIGPNGDRPLDLHAAKLIPDKVVEIGFNIVADMSEARDIRHQYMRDLYQAFVDLRREQWADVLFVHDEAHFDAPETNKVNERPVCFGAIMEGMSLFRKRGVKVILATQRLAKLAKDAAAECDNKLVGNFNLADDRERALRELGVYSEKKTWLPVISKLQPGQFIAVGRAFGLREPTLIQLDMPKTRPPPKGRRSAFRAPAPRQRVIDVLEALKELPQEAEKKLRTEADLRAEVKALRAEVTRAKRVNPPQSPVEVTKRVEVPVLKADQLARLERLADRLAKDDERSSTAMEEVRDRFAAGQLARQEIRDAIRGVAVRLNATIHAGPVQPVHVGQSHGVGDAKAKPPANGGGFGERRAPDAGRSQPMVHVGGEPSGTLTGGPLPKGEQAVLTAVAQYEAGVERDQLSVLTGYKRSSRDAYLQRLRERGLIQAMGDQVVATPAGVAALGPSFEPLHTGQALREYWVRRLPEGERKVLEVLIRAYPASVERQAIDEATQYKRSSRDAYLQRLKARRLIETAGGAVTASATLFEEAVYG